MENKNKTKEAISTDAKLSNNLIGISPTDKLRLKNKNGKTVFMTLSEAKKKHNFKQLNENSQKVLTNGVSATKVINDLG